MPKVYAMIENGTEEVECLAVVDILRRAGIDVVLVSAASTETVVSSHGVKITADALLDAADLSDGDALFIPGGMPGSARLGGNARLVKAIEKTLRRGKRVAAICAAPAVVLGANGFLNGVRAICFPGFEEQMRGAEIVDGARVVTDGNITTARGLGCAIELGLELVRLLLGNAVAEDVKTKIQF